MEEAVGGPHVDPVVIALQADGSCGRRQQKGDASRDQAEGHKDAEIAPIDRSNPYSRAFVSAQPMRWVTRAVQVSVVHVVDCNVSKHLAVDLNASLVQAVDQLRVRHALLTSGRVDSARCRVGAVNGDSTALVASIASVFSGFPACTAALSLSNWLVVDAVIISQGVKIAVRQLPSTSVGSGTLRG